MQSLAVHKPMHSVHLKGGDILYVTTEAAERISAKSAGFVQIGDEFVNVFEIVRMRPVKMTDIEQAIFAYPPELRSKLTSRRAELQEKVGRDFKNAEEVHAYAKLQSEK